MRRIAQKDRPPVHEMSAESDMRDAKRQFPVVAGNRLRRYNPSERWEMYDQ